jgi:hypothetical protein
MMDEKGYCDMNTAINLLKMDSETDSIVATATQAVVVCFSVCAG